MSPIVSRPLYRLAGPATVLAALAAGQAAAAHAATSQPTQRTTANRLAQKIDIAGAKTMGERFSCAASPAAPTSPRVIVYVRSTRDQNTATKIGQQQARALGGGASSVNIKVRVGQQARSRSTLTPLAKRLNRSLDTERGEAAFVATGAGKSQCGRIQLYIGSSPSAKLSRWARAQHRRYGASRVRIVRSLVGTAAR